MVAQYNRKKLFLALINAFLNQGVWGVRIIEACCYDLMKVWDVTFITY